MRLEKRAGAALLGAGVLADVVGGCESAARAVVLGLGDAPEIALRHCPNERAAPHQQRAERASGQHVLVIVGLSEDIIHLPKHDSRVDVAASDGVRYIDVKY